MHQNLLDSAYHLRTTRRSRRRAVDGRRAVRWHRRGGRGRRHQRAARGRRDRRSAAHACRQHQFVRRHPQQTAARAHGAPSCSGPAHARRASHAARRGASGGVPTRFLLRAPWPYDRRTTCHAWCMYAAPGLSRVLAASRAACASLKGVACLGFGTAGLSHRAGGGRAPQRTRTAPARSVRQVLVRRAGSSSRCSGLLAKRSG